ncbi:hypothetical protein Hypma_006976 [Hypsizygus marmoreus]|uniref:Uncharacterized protein n=1 Tax=Hypsizygus marmoreus TaxID=39966 RepID=A0A369K1E0_HYPMA|nr:hypothetical protein Hypma_006976 [Hypsizygus marmoreus]
MFVYQNPLINSQPSGSGDLNGLSMSLEEADKYSTKQSDSLSKETLTDTEASSKLPAMIVNVSTGGRNVCQGAKKTGCGGGTFTLLLFVDCSAEALLGR